MGPTRNKKRKMTESGGSINDVDTSPVVQEELTDVGAKRRPWAAVEDEQLRALVAQHGVKNWALIATALYMRNGKQVSWTRAAQRGDGTSTRWPDCA